MSIPRPLPESHESEAAGLGGHALFALRERFAPFFPDGSFVFRRRFRRSSDSSSTPEGASRRRMLDPEGERRREERAHSLPLRLHPRRAPPSPSPREGPPPTRRSRRVSAVSRSSLVVRTASSPRRERPGDVFSGACAQPWTCTSSPRPREGCLPPARPRPPGPPRPPPPRRPPRARRAYRTASRPPTVVSSRGRRSPGPASRAAPDARAMPPPPRRSSDLRLASSASSREESLCVSEASRSAASRSWFASALRLAAATAMPENLVPDILGRARGNEECQRRVSLTRWFSVVPVRSAGSRHVHVKVVRNVGSSGGTNRSGTGKRSRGRAVPPAPTAEVPRAMPSA